MGSPSWAGDRSRRGGRSCVGDLSQHEPGAASKAPAGYDRREAPGRAAGDHDLQIVVLAELRNQGRVVLGVRVLAYNVLSQAIVALTAGHYVAHCSLLKNLQDATYTR